MNALVSVFDIGHVHEINLPNVEPRIPKRRPEWSDSFFEAVCAEAYRETIDRRREADELRRRIKALIASGSIKEIVEDESGFMDDEPLSDAELTVADKLAPVAKASK